MCTDSSVQICSSMFTQPRLIVRVRFNVLLVCRDLFICRKLRFSFSSSHVFFSLKVLLIHPLLAFLQREHLLEFFPSSQISSGLACSPEPLLKRRHDDNILFFPQKLSPTHKEHRNPGRPSCKPKPGPRARVGTGRRALH